MSISIESRAKQHLLFDSEEGEVFSLSSIPLPAACQPDAPFEDKVKLAIESLISYIEQGKHLVVGTSYGKDSSITNALTCQAMLEARKRGMNIPHVVFAHSLTTYDNPAMDEYALGEMRKSKDIRT